MEAKGPSEGLLMCLFLPIPWHCSGKGSKQGTVTASRGVRRLGPLIPAGLFNGEGILLMQPRKCKEIQVCMPLIQHTGDDRQVDV